MKMLTISQPFANLIRDGERRIENRRWNTRFRGLVGIHAGKGTQYLDRGQLGGVDALYPAGFLLAVGRLVDCVSMMSLEIKSAEGRGGVRIAGGAVTVDEILASEHCEGPELWMFDDVIPLKNPIAMSGQPGLWDWSAPAGFVEAYDRKLRLTRR